MATVYLAEDLRHRRKVAMKVLRAELAASLGPDRFVGEIEVLARLTHPHILPLHDSGVADGFLFYVMPYVDGESLRTRLDRAGEMPVGDVVRILYEVADALSYAHELGVVHRDIKPDNVMLSGRHALVMDFGVAKALSAATGRHAITTAGIALGTPAYMAPEQAAADSGMDHRVDIYALGAMGYEMLTGMPPFTGRTAQEVLSAHVTREPAPVAERRPGTPSALADLIMGCLAKRPADRWQTADEVRQRLEALVTPSGGITPTTTRPVAAVARPAGRRTRLVVAGVALLALLAAVFAYMTLRPGAETVELGRRVQVTLGPELDLDPALSPDGRLIAYASGTAGDTRIYVRQVAGGAAVAVADDVPGRQRAPRWSPDGGSILFTAGRGLHLVPALGGMSRLVVDAAAAGGVVDASWSPDGRSIAYIRGDSLIRRQIETGAERGLAEGGGLMLASWSPDGRWIAVADGNRGFMYGTRFLGDLAPARIVLIPAEGGEPVEIAGGGSLNTSPAWLRSDALLYVSNRDGARDVYVQRLDRRGAPSGDPRRLTVGLSAHAVSVSADGTALAYATLVESVNVWSLPFGAGGALDTALLRAETREQQVVEGFDISPDGRWLVFDSNRDGHQQIFRAAIDGGTVQQLTRGAGDSFIPRFSPDGREIVFHSYHRERGSSSSFRPTAGRCARSPPARTMTSSRRGRRTAPRWCSSVAPPTPSRYR